MPQDPFEQYLVNKPSSKPAEDPFAQYLVPTPKVAAPVVEEDVLEPEIEEPVARTAKPERSTLGKIKDFAFKSLLPLPEREQPYTPENIPQFHERALQEIGKDVYEGFTSPFGIATTLVGGPVVRGALKGASKLTKMLPYGEEALEAAGKFLTKERGLFDKPAAPVAERPAAKPFIGPRNKPSVVEEPPIIAEPPPDLRIDPIGGGLTTAETATKIPGGPNPTMYGIQEAEHMFPSVPSRMQKPSLNQEMFDALMPSRAKEMIGQTVKTGSEGIEALAEQAAEKIPAVTGTPPKAIYNPKFGQQKIDPNIPVVISNDANTAKRLTDAYKNGYKVVGMSDDGSIQLQKIAEKAAKTPEDAILADAGVKPPIKPPKPPVATASGTPPPTSPVAQDIVNSLPDKRPYQPGMMQNMWDFTKGMMSVDLPFMSSAAFRQASSHIGTKRWFQAWADAARSYGSKVTSDMIQEQILKDPLFVRPRVQVISKSTGKPILDKATGLPKMKETPSDAERIGFRLGDLSKYGARDEAIRSGWAEIFPWVRGSNRAYNAFINRTGYSALKTQLKIAKDLGHDPLGADLELGKAISEAVQTTLKRGKLGIEFGKRGIALEKGKEFGDPLGIGAQILNNTLWSPRTIASEVRMLNPTVFATADPMIQRYYAANALRRVGFWVTTAMAFKAAGGEVNLQWTNPDFLKLKIGNVRIDPPGGLQQYIVALGQLAHGGKTSSTTGKFTKFGEGFPPTSHGSIVSDFFRGRIHPSADLAMDLASQPNLGAIDRVLQSVAPMFATATAEVVKENPELAPVVALLSGSGMGTQSYEKGSFGKPVFIPEEYDVKLHETIRTTRGRKGRNRSTGRRGR